MNTFENVSLCHWEICSSYDPHSLYWHGDKRHWKSPKLAVSLYIKACKSDLQFPQLFSSCPFHAIVSKALIFYRIVFNRWPWSQSTPRPSSINLKNTSTGSILVMAPDELCTSLGVATKMPQTHLNIPYPRSGFHRGQLINSFMTKVLLTAIRCWTLHREWSHPSFISFNVNTTMEQFRSYMDATRCGKTYHGKYQ